MNVLLSISLWLALVVSSCCENAGSPYDDNDMPTPTPEYDEDYDYNATFDYYYVTMAHNSTNRAEDNEVSTRNEVSRTGQPTLGLSLGLAVLQLWK